MYFLIYLVIPLKYMLKPTEEQKKKKKKKRKKNGLFLCMLEKTRSLPKDLFNIALLFLIYMYIWISPTFYHLFL